MRRSRQIRIEGDVAFVALTKGYEAIIDLDDIPLVQAYSWHASVQPHTIYAKTNIRDENGTRKALYLHRHLMQPEGGMLVDHKDGNGLNNRRNGDCANLRIATRAQNQQNQRHRNKTPDAKPKGVSEHGSGWRARIMVDGNAVHLGTFQTKEGARSAYRNASADLHGDFGNPT